MVFVAFVCGALCFVFGATGLCMWCKMLLHVVYFALVCGVTSFCMLCIVLLYVVHFAVVCGATGFCMWCILLHLYVLYTVIVFNVHAFACGVCCMGFTCIS